MEITCKKCGGKEIIKNGMVRNKQRYRCKECGYNFVSGDARTNDMIRAKKALIFLLYSLAKASYTMLGKLFNICPSQIYRWIAKEGESLPEPSVSGDIQEIEFDEMWHFIAQKKQNLAHQSH